MNFWTLTSPDGDTIEVDVVDLAAAEIAAADWVADYAEPTHRTTWETITITSPDGDSVELHVEVEPEEPECSEDDGHDWRDGSVYGSGGGVAWTSTCKGCGLRRRTDTWAADPCSGWRYGTMVEYLLPE